MIQFLQQRLATLVFIGLVSLMLVLMSHDIGNRGGADVAGELLFKAGAPAVRAGSSMTSFFTDMFQNYVFLRGARAENRRLTEALDRAERERDGYRDLANASQRLQALLDLKKDLRVPSVAARVAGSGLAGGSATLLIDRGTSDGIRMGMPVVAVGGVVGRIVLAGEDLSKVECITDPSSGVAVALSTSGYQGMLIGRTPVSCELIYLPPYAEVAHGDLLVTSGLDRIYPRGLSAGRIVGVPEGAGVERRFEVKPEVDFQRISEVLVLKTPPLKELPSSPGDRR